MNIFKFSFLLKLIGKWMFGKLYLCCNNPIISKPSCVVCFLFLLNGAIIVKNVHS